MAPKAIPVVGHADFQGGVVNLRLVPGAPPPAQVIVVPSYEAIMNFVQDGTLDVHESRLPLTRNDLLVAIRNIQARFGQATGWGGWWSDQAWEQLQRWLVSAKRRRLQLADPDTCLALPAPPLAPPGPLLALPAPPSPTSTSTSTTSSTSSNKEESEEEAEVEGKDVEVEEEGEDEYEAAVDEDVEVEGVMEVQAAGVDLPLLDDLGWSGADWPTYPRACRVMVNERCGHKRWTT